MREGMNRVINESNRVKIGVKFQTGLPCLVAMLDVVSMTTHVMRVWHILCVYHCKTAD